jgi:hypothetical protein
MRRRAASSDRTAGIGTWEDGRPDAPETVSQTGSTTESRNFVAGTVREPPKIRALLEAPLQTHLYVKRALRQFPFLQSGDGFHLFLGPLASGSREDFAWKITLRLLRKGD